jgi:hypothetical protein
VDERIDEFEELFGEFVRRALAAESGSSTERRFPKKNYFHPARGSKEDGSRP